MSRGAPAVMSGVSDRAMGLFRCVWSVGSCMVCLTSREHCSHCVYVGSRTLSGSRICRSENSDHAGGCLVGGIYHSALPARMFIAYCPSRTCCEVWAG